MPSTSTSTPRAPTAAHHPVRTFVVIALAAALGFVAISTFDYMLGAMQADLGFTLDAGTVALLVPAVGGLTVVFLAGTLGDDLGRRRVVIAGATTFAVGALVVTTAPTLGVVSAGRAVEGIGGLVTSIVALALLSDTYVDPRQRAIAFGAGAAVTPAVVLVAPPIGALIVEHGSWRVVSIGWLAMGALTVVAALRLLPPDPPVRRPEVVTPLLAGVVLVGITGTGVTLALGATRPMLVLVALGIAAAIALRIALRSVTRPGLDLRILRTPTGALVLLAILLSTAINVLFFVKLFLQAQNDLNVVTVAYVMIPVAFGGVVGAVGSSMVMRRIGPLWASVVLLLGAALASLLIIPLGAGETVWLTIAFAAVYAMFEAAALGPMAAALMDLAPPGGEGAAAAQRRAFISVGVAIGAAVAGTLVFGTFQTTFTETLVRHGVPRDVASAAAVESRAEGVAHEVAGGIETRSPALIALGPRVAAASADAQRTAYKVAALAGVATYVLAALLMMLAARRHRRASS